MNDKGIEDPIIYSARDSIYTDFRTRTVHLYGDAKVDNGLVKMSAGYIMIDLDKNEVLARYAYDKDSNKIEYPLFTDGSDEIKASSIRYNLDTEKGYIEEVAIQQDENYLYMGIAKRQANEEIHFRKGRFTTCNLEEPHYHFQLSKAVLIPDKRIVSGAMNLYISGVPTPLGLPFAVIPQAEEKNKGLLFPEIVPTSVYGFGINRLGYYIPVNDNFQTSIYGSIYSRGSWELSTITDYAKRYSFQGNLGLGFQQFKSGFPENSNNNKLTFNWQHRKDPKSSPYWGFSSNVNFISDNTTQNNLDPLNAQYFNNTLYSDVNVTRAFPGKPVTAGMKLNLKQNSLSKNVSLEAPIINVNMTRIFPFRKYITGRNNVLRSALKQTGIAYNFEARNQSTFKDSLLRSGDLGGINDAFLQGVSHNATLQTTIGLFKNTWKLTPSVTYSNKINLQQSAISFSLADSSYVRDTIGELASGSDLTLSASLTTAVYSYFRFVGKKKPLLRHVLTPSFSFQYIPGLNEALTRTDVIGVDTFSTNYSIFDIGVYRPSIGRNQMLLNFGFNNTFELKRINAKDTVDGFRRTRIIDALSINGNYDFLKDSMNLSDFTLALRINPLPWVNFVSGGTFSPYGWIDSSGMKISEFAVNSNGTLGRFLSSNFSTTLTLTSKESREKIKQTSETLGNNWNADYQYFVLHPERAINFNIPWKVNFSHVYTLNTNQNRSTVNPDRILQQQTLVFDGDVSFTKRWKITTTTNFDLKELDITNARFTLLRDMHCWALSFNWTPIGGNKSFIFSIRNTSALFQDAKIDLRKPPAFL